VERRCDVELGRGVRHVRHLQGAGDGRLPAVSSREQEGLLRQAGLRRGVGRVQPLLPLLLHVPVGEAEQPVPALPAGVVHPAHGEVGDGRCRQFLLG